MNKRKADAELDFEALRLGIEGRDPDLVLGFYAEEAELSIINADAPKGSSFELRGKAEIAKQLRATFGQGTSHRVEGANVGDERATFREVCRYPDGSQVLVETTLELRGGKIVRQVDAVARDIPPDHEEASGPRAPARNTRPNNPLGTGALPSDRPERFEQATEKEEPG